MSRALFFYVIFLVSCLFTSLTAVQAAKKTRFCGTPNDLQRLERLHTMPSLELLGNRTKILLGKHIIRTMEELVGLLQDEGGNKDGSDNFTSNNVFSEELLVFSKALTFHAAYAIVKPWTLVAIDQHEIMYNEISRMNANNISGAVVECGVWAGGSSMMMMYSQIRSGSTQRHFWMNDTYQGHVAPDVTKDSETDCNIWKSVTHKDKTKTFVSECIFYLTKRRKFFVFCYVASVFHMRTSSLKVNHDISMTKDAS
jgi:hypothetical protein